MSLLLALRRCTARLVACAALLLAAGPARAGDVPDPDPARFQDAIAQFARWDARNRPPADPILFAGSSSIVNWPTAEAFPGLPVVNRGFGGSQMSELNHYFDQVVKPYTPRLIVVYSGDNDVEAGKLADQVATDYREFLDRVRADVPAARVILLSIKPSESRWDRWEEMRRTNERLAELCRTQPYAAFARFVDVATPMLGPDQRPRPDYYLPDRLHLSPAGYAEWNRILHPLLTASPTSNPH